MFYLYKIYFSNNFKPFDDKYKIREILQSIFNNVNLEDLFNILNVCSSLFEEKEGRLKPLDEVVIQNFTVPDHLNVNDKADLYCYGLGNYYHLLGDYEKDLDSCDKAINENPGHAAAWNNKGLSLDSLGRYEEAITLYDKAIEIKPDHADAWIVAATVVLLLLPLLAASLASLPLPFLPLAYLLLRLKHS